MSNTTAPVKTLFGPNRNGDIFVDPGTWAISNLKMMETSTGVAYVGALLHNGDFVGTVENDGRGGADRFDFPHGEDFTAELESLEASFAPFSTMFVPSFVELLIQRFEAGQ